MYKECVGDPEKEYKIIFTDLSMPEIDGYELTKKIRELSKNQSVQPVIIAITGHTESEFFNKAL